MSAERFELDQTKAVRRSHLRKTRWRLLKLLLLVFILAFLLR